MSFQMAFHGVALSVLPRAGSSVSHTSTAMQCLGPLNYSNAPLFAPLGAKETPEKAPMSQ